MEMYQDGVEVLCIVGFCDKDEEKRGIADLDECPMGEESCSGDCLWYKENYEEGEKYRN